MTKSRQVGTGVVSFVACLVALAVPGATAATTYVHAGDDLQAAINAAQPGDTLRLQAGATFIGNFVLTDKGASPTYITIRSDAPDGSLPPADVRIKPSDAPYLAKLESPNTSSALTTTPTAHHWRLLLLEFLPNDRGYGDVISLGSGETDQNSLSLVPHDFILDRVYVHGHPVTGQKRGVALHSGATDIVNCYLSDFKASGIEAQALMGYNGPGPYNIVNNYLEGSTQSFLMGGASPQIPNMVPTNVVIRHNYLAKPLAWKDPILATPLNVAASGGTGGALVAGTYYYRVVAARAIAIDEWVWSDRSAEVAASVGPNGAVSLSWTASPNAVVYRVYRGGAPGQQDRYFEAWGPPSFVDQDLTPTGWDTGNWVSGSRWTVKNLFELKEGFHVTVDGNVMDHAWEQAQTGYAVLFTPRNQDGTSPWVFIRDVTFTNNLVRHAGSGVQIQGYDDAATSQQTQGITIRNNIFADINSDPWGGSGRFVQIGASPASTTIDHNTVFHTGQIVFVYGGLAGVPDAVQGFTLTNNLFRHNDYGIMGDNHAVGNDSIAYYFPGSTITHNTLADGPSWLYPAGNQFPTLADWMAGFVDVADGNYHLTASSPSRNAGTDGTDLGANVDTVMTAAAVALSGDNRGGTPPLPVQITTTSLPHGTVGASYTATLQASGGSGAYVWTTSALPAGLALTASTGVIAGTPSAVATLTLTVTVRDASVATNTASAPLGLTISAAPLVLTSTSVPNGVAHVAYSAALQTTGGLLPLTFSLTAGALPVGLTLNSGSGVIAGTPSTGGTATFTVRVQDASAPAQTVTRSFSLLVTAPPTVVLTSPTAGAVFTAPASIALTATATSSTATIATVKFWAGPQLVGTRTVAPYATTWTNVPVGAYALTAVATDSTGLSTTSAAVPITVRPPPAATFTAPSTGATGVPTQLLVQWTSVGAPAYYLYIGTAVGTKNVVDTGEIHTTSYQVSDLPVSQLLFARIWTKYTGGWTSSDITFTTSSQATLPPQATFVYPLQGATGIDTTRPFAWTTVPGAQAYYLYVGDSAGWNNRINTGEITATSFPMTGLPTGVRLYGRIWTKVNGTWASSDVTFTLGVVVPPASFIYPLPGATGIGTAQPFSWTPVAGAQAYYLYVGDLLGWNNRINSGEITATSFPMTGLPIGVRLYARIWTKLNGVWVYSDVSFTP